ncbi:MAG: hypothetical protein QM500_03715 [Methylococcales bacterium]
MKSQNIIPLGGIVGVCLVVSWCVVYGIQGLNEYKGFVSELGGTAFILVVSTWVANILPAEIKHRIIFFRYKNSLPGHRFMSLIKRDSRIDLEKVETKYGFVGGKKYSAKEQNKIWYNDIYIPNQEQLLVCNAHKSFLLYRDASSVVILMAVFILAIGFYHDALSPLFSIVMIIESVLLAVAANSLGNRFVTTAVVVSVS